MKQHPLKYLLHHYNNKVFSEAIVSSQGLRITPPSKSARVREMSYLNTPWDDKGFESVNLPLRITRLDTYEQSVFSYPNDLRVLDMPIKFAGNNQYRIPQELMQFIPTIMKAADYEHAMNEKVKDYYCYITVDQKEVSAGHTTRKSGLHVDGFQGARIIEPHFIDHSYVIYDKMPTIFYNQKFKVEPHWNKTCHNYFEGFAAQAKKENQVTYPNYELLLIHAYCLHEAPMVQTSQYRTFLRLSYTLREFDRLGNAHNPMFEYSWEMLPRDIQKTLVCPL